MEAASLYEKNPEEFKARARSCVMDWKEALYSVREHPDPSYLIFSPYQSELHSPVREQMKRGVEEEQQEGGGAGPRAGKSYVATGSLMPRWLPGGENVTVFAPPPGHWMRTCAALDLRFNYTEFAQTDKITHYQDNADRVESRRRKKEREQQVMTDLEKNVEELA